jgi:hypothetical protein
MFQCIKVPYVNNSVHPTCGEEAVGVIVNNYNVSDEISVLLQEHMIFQFHWSNFTHHYFPAVDIFLGANSKKKENFFASISTVQAKVRSG